jgi:aconitase A
MLGQPVYLLTMWWVFEMTGQLRGVTATDLVLTVTGLLRSK